MSAECGGIQGVFRGVRPQRVFYGTLESLSLAWRAIDHYPCEGYSQHREVSWGGLCPPFLGAGGRLKHADSWTARADLVNVP